MHAGCSTEAFSGMKHAELDKMDPDLRFLGKKVYQAAKKSVRKGGSKKDHENRSMLDQAQLQTEHCRRASRVATQHTKARKRA